MASPFASLPSFAAFRRLSRLWLLLTMASLPIIFYNSSMHEEKKIFIVPQYRLSSHLPSPRVGHGLPEGRRQASGSTSSLNNPSQPAACSDPDHHHGQAPRSCSQLGPTRWGRDRAPHGYLRGELFSFVLKIAFEGPGKLAYLNYS